MAARFDWAVPTILGNNDEPTLATDAATKNYVDNALANVSGSSIANGTSNVSIATANGGASFNLAGGTNTLLVTNDGSNNANLSSSGNILLSSNVAVPTGNLLVSSGNLTLSNVNKLRIPGGTSGQYLTTDGSSNLSWVTNSGSSLITSLTCDSYQVGATATKLIPWTIVKNEIGLTFTTLGGVSNSQITYTGTGTLVLLINYFVTWSLPNAPTGVRRTGLTENSNNIDVVFSEAITGFPGIIQTGTSIVELDSNSGGINLQVENYSSDDAYVGGSVSPISDYLPAPSVRMKISLLGTK